MVIVAQRRPVQLAAMLLSRIFGSRPVVPPPTRDCQMFVQNERKIAGAKVSAQPNQRRLDGCLWIASKN